MPISLQRIPLSHVVGFTTTWTQLASTWTSAPVAQAYSGGDGEVYAYTYGSQVYYRFVPSSYDSTQDAFYTTYSNPTLSGLVATRGVSL